MLALIDGDIIVYRVGFAAEQVKYNIYQRGSEEEFGPIVVKNTKKEADDFILESLPGLTEITGDEGIYFKKEIVPDPINNCLHSVKVVLSSMIEELGATHYKVFLTGQNQFRPLVATLKPYKGNRDPLHKPFHYNDIKEYLRKYWDAQDVDHYEADDMLAMEHYKAHMRQANDNYGVYYHFDPDHCPSIICTIDKDLDQIPGWHYNFVKKEKYFIDPDYALRWFYTQLLAGDPTDNIPGIPGVGIKKAEKALADCATEQEMYKVAQGMYEKAYQEKAQEALLETAKLIYMIREEGKQWHPPI